MMYKWSVLPKFEREEILEQLLQRNLGLHFFSPPPLRRSFPAEGGTENQGDHTPNAPQTRSGHPLSSPDSPFWMDSPRGGHTRMIRARGRVTRAQVHETLARPRGFD